eukprot:gb/GFBE01080280.1/.p1 GENE.gb/GFBE01080280.1/~~gb/GFBE01080280.1/.p1  ORF type:complete len:100 (+),score=10.52 gb/GFBE01080280.1/:1-300(+)
MSPEGYSDQNKHVLHQIANSSISKTVPLEQLTAINSAPGAVESSMLLGAFVAPCQAMPTPSSSRHLHAGVTQVWQSRMKKAMSIEIVAVRDSKASVQDL